MRSLAFLAAILLSACGSPPSFEESPGRWMWKECTIHVDAVLEDVARSAADKWNVIDADQPTLTIVVEAGDSSFNQSSSARYGQVPDPNQVGVTYVWTAGDPELQGQIVEADIILSAVAPWDDGLFPIYSRETVLLHEMGHLLGLPHSRDETDIMWPIIPKDTNGRIPSAADEATLADLYR